WRNPTGVGGTGRVRGIGTEDGHGGVRVGGSGGGDPHAVSRETVQPEPDAGSVPQPRTGSGFSGTAMGRAPANGVPPLTSPAGVGQTVEFHLSAVPEKTSTGTVYGRGAVPVSDRPEPDERASTAGRAA